MDITHNPADQITDIKDSWETRFIDYDKEGNKARRGKDPEWP
jgi:hypothetical protein